MTVIDKQATCKIWHWTPIVLHGNPPPPLHFSLAHCKLFVVQIPPPPHSFACSFLII